MEGLHPNAIFVVEIRWTEFFDVGSCTENVGEFTDKDNNINWFILSHWLNCLAYLTHHQNTQTVEIFRASQRNIPYVAIVVKVNLRIVGCSSNTLAEQAQSIHDLIRIYDIKIANDNPVIHWNIRFASSFNRISNFS